METAANSIEVTVSRKPCEYCPVDSYYGNLFGNTLKATQHHLQAARPWELVLNRAIDE